MTDLRTRLAAVPDPELARAPAIERAIAHSIAYLGSDAAQRSLDADTYWPKWHSPWWHMRALHELDEARRIPARAVDKMIERLNALRIQMFPIHPGDAPLDADPHRDSSCHCAVGTISQVLAACGADDRAVPWLAPWLVRYQMADGGHNCDAAAYVRGDDGASSMVATVPLFEAMLLRPAWSADERVFVDRTASPFGDAAGRGGPVVDRAAGFLLERRLMDGSRSTYNAEERTAAPAWLQPCFPRLYFYDVLRGLAALVRWAELGAHSIPLGAVSDVIEHLVADARDGVIRTRRCAWAGMRTLVERDGAWVREPAATFPLLEVTGGLGEPSEPLTRQWSATRRALIRLIDDGRLA